MIHSTRVFSSRELDSEDDLVEAMTKHKWVRAKNEANAIDVYVRGMRTPHVRHLLIAGDWALIE